MVSVTISPPQTTATTGSDLPLRCVSIDVEEYFHIEAAHHTIPRSAWDQWPSRVEANTDLLLSLFDQHNQRGTFFILGDVARRHPQLARRVAAAGHEVASHGTGHDRLHRLEARGFREGLLASKHLLEDQTGNIVLGYRAPTFSVVPETAWAIDTLIDAGFQYDASIFPVRHPWYGVPTAPDRPFMVQSRTGAPTLLEIPPLTWTLPSVMGDHRRLAVAGGGYFRLMPLWVMRRGLDQAAAQGRPAVLYFHPWEFDPHMPRMPLPFLNRLRTYTGLRSAAKRLGQIMAQPARWLPLARAIAELSHMAASLPTFCLDPHP